MRLQSVLTNIKNDFDSAISTATFNGKNYTNGLLAKEALIRSQKIINYLHDFIKSEFISCQVGQEKLYPSLGKTKPEIKIKGFLKSKNQDVSVVPDAEYVKLTNSKSLTNEKILTVNIRSQLSSMSKNIDTLYERTFAEALNLHLNFPKQCLGEVYLIPTHEYDDRPMKANRIAFKSVSKIERYIEMFQAINNRMLPGNEYRYERVALIIADFRQSIPKVYNSTKMLKGDGLLSNNSSVTLENLVLDYFASDLLEIYSNRFGSLLVS